jgi:hypothetical protein
VLTSLTVPFAASVRKHRAPLRCFVIIKGWKLVLSSSRPLGSDIADYCVPQVGIVGRVIGVTMLIAEAGSAGG